MKTALVIYRRSRPAQSGSAVLVILILLAIMLLFSQANTLTLYRLNREVKMAEKQQIQRWASLGSQSTTNHLPAK